MTLPFTLLQGAYIIAVLVFILALAGLSKHETAKAGNTNGVIGMGIALIITLFAAVFGVTSGGETVQEAGGIRACLLYTSVCDIAGSTRHAVVRSRCGDTRRRRENTCSSVSLGSRGRVRPGSLPPPRPSNNFSNSGIRSLSKLSLIHI